MPTLVYCLIKDLVGFPSLATAVALCAPTLLLTMGGIWTHLVTDSKHDVGICGDATVALSCIIWLSVSVIAFMDTFVITDRSGKETWKSEISIFWMTEMNYLALVMPAYVAFWAIYGG